MKRCTFLWLWASGCGAAQQTAPEAPAPEPEPEVVEPAPAAEPATLTLATEAGEVVITPVYHGTVRLQHGDTVVWIDPWSKAALPDAPEADVVLITDVHSDHLDPEALAKVATDDTVFVAPSAVAEAEGMAGRTVQHVLANGDEATVGPMTVRAVAMYNNVRGPEGGGVFHDKGRGNGYVVTIGGSDLYLAGDTECTDEMKALTGIEHALLPMNLPYTMTPEEAAECVKVFRPAKVTPIHYAGSDLAVFADALSGEAGIEVQLVNAYPGGLPW